MYNIKSYAVYKFKQREDIMTALTVVIIAVAAALVAGFIAFICGFFTENRYRKNKLVLLTMKREELSMRR